MVYGSRIITNLFLPNKYHWDWDIFLCVRIEFTNHGHCSGLGLFTKYLSTLTLNNPFEIFYSGVLYVYVKALLPQPLSVSDRIIKSGLYIRRYKSFMVKIRGGRSSRLLIGYCFLRLFFFWSDTTLNLKFSRVSPCFAVFPPIQLTQLTINLLKSPNFKQMAP